MTIPTTPQKRFLAAGAVRSSQTWGTSQLLTAGSGILIDSDGGLVRSQAYHPAYESDTPFPSEGDLGDIDPVDFTPEFFMRYDPGTLGVLLAQFFGIAGAPSGVGGGWAHTFQWADDNDGKFVTFAIERARKILEVPSAKLFSFDLSLADGFVRGSMGLRGNTLINNSTVNGYTQMDALVYKDTGHRIRFGQLTSFLTHQSNGSAPWATTAIKISDISMHFERPHDGLHGGGSDSIMEPMQNGAPVITMSLTFPRMDVVNDAYFADFIAEIEKKACFSFVGPEYESGQNYMLSLRFPRLRVINVDYPYDEIIPCTMTLQVEKAADYTGFVSPYPYMILHNKRAIDYLHEPGD